MTVETLQATQRTNVSLYEPIYQPQVIKQAVTVWARARTDADTTRHVDLLRDKTNMVMSFFNYAGAHPSVASPQDVENWIQHLQDRGLSSATIYGYASRLSSWYRWAQSDDQMKKVVQGNPVVLARPKPPKRYQHSKALTEKQIQKLLQAVPRNTTVGLRDYALLVWYLHTGHRRSEVIRLRWSDLERNDDNKLQVTFKVKGGDYIAEEVSDTCWTTLVDYLRASDRLDSMSPDTPLWIGHAYNNTQETQLVSHSFVKSFKRYAKKAGLTHVHLHQLRHTFASWVADSTGDISKVQQALGHKNQETTRVYVEKLGVKKDNHSHIIARKMGL